MLRLFVALELPPAVRDGLLAAMGGVVGARWQRDDQLHLTLRFIGDVDRHRALDIAAALDGVHFTPFDAALTVPGVFGNRGRNEALWVGITPQDAVSALAKRIDRALQRVGLPPETRAFLPHVTVARLGRETGPLTGFPLQPLPMKPFAINGFALWESRLTRDGADYRIIERYPIYPIA